MKKLIKIITACVLTMCICLPVYAADTNNSISFTPWSENNIYAGEDERSNISIKLNKENLAYMISEAFNLTEGSKDKQISDMTPQDWSYKYVQKVVQNGIMKLDSSGKFHPSEYVKREEIPEILNFLPLKYSSVNKTDKYNDIKDIDSQYSDKMKKFLSSDYMSVVSENYILPKRIATVSDFIETLNKIFPNINTPKMKDQVYDKNFLIRNKMTYIENVTVNGDLYITQGAIKEDSKITLKNVNVKGNIYILGGSSHGEYIFDHIKAQNLNIEAKDNVLININNSQINKIKNKSNQAVFITNVKLNFD